MSARRPSTRRRPTTTKPDKVEFKVKQDAKGIRGKSRPSFVDSNGKPKNSIYRGELSKDRTKMVMVGEYNVHTGKYRNGHKERTINIKYVEILGEEESDKIKTELSYTPVTNNVYDHTDTRIIGQLVFNKEEGVSEASGREWRVSSDHTREYVG
mgnify:CR=1 FL=1